jgi:hypothetical protein
LSKIKYEVKKEIATLSQNAKGWKKQLNLVSWNDQAPKFDIRVWDETHSKMGKGVTLSEKELKGLYESLKDYFDGKNNQGTTNAGTLDIEKELENLTNKAPLFIQEMQNIIRYMDEEGYSNGEKREIILQEETSISLPLKNEIESISTMYQQYYAEYAAFLQKLDGEGLAKVLNV